MKKELPKRKKIRLKDYDYSSAGYYFITICVEGGQHTLGHIVGAAPLRICFAYSCRGNRSSRPQMELSRQGNIVEAWIGKIRDKYPHIKVESSVVMPNHVHMMLSIDSDEQTGMDKRTAIDRAIGYYKYQTTKEINQPGFWQRSFHDHIIRDEKSFLDKMQYIEENPARWFEDEYNKAQFSGGRTQYTGGMTPPLHPN